MIQIHRLPTEAERTILEPFVGHSRKLAADAATARAAAVAAHQTLDAVATRLEGAKGVTFDPNLMAWTREVAEPATLSGEVDGPVSITEPTEILPGTHIKGGLRVGTVEEGGS